MYMANVVYVSVTDLVGLFFSSTQSVLLADIEAEVLESSGTSTEECRAQSEQAVTL